MVENVIKRASLARAAIRAVRDRYRPKAARRTAAAQFIQRTPDFERSAIAAAFLDANHHRRCDQ